jgi:multidrug efflux pump subunit AcrA (membrane-fusion protein)
LETLRIQLERLGESFEEENSKRLEELHAAKGKTEELKNDDLTIAELKIEKQQAQYEQFLYQHEKEVRRIEQQIAALKEEAQAEVLTAPYDGIIEEVARLYEGDQVYNGQWLVSLYSTDRLLFKAEKAVNKLRYNMDVMVETGKGDTLKTYQGKVIAAPNILPLSLSQDMILIELDGEIEEAQLKAGFRFRGISEDVQEILMVERGAIQQEDGKEYVYVLDGDMIQKRYVETALSASDAVWILDGLKEGQTLIVD